MPEALAPNIDIMFSAMLSICYSKFEIAMMKNYLEMSPEAKQGFKTFLKEVAPTIKAEADEGRVAEGPAGYEARRMPDKEAFEAQLEAEIVTKGKSSASHIDDTENLA